MRPWQPATPFIQSVSVNSYFSISGGAVGLFGRRLAAEPGRSRRRLPGAGFLLLHLRSGRQCPGRFHELRTFNQGAGEFENNRNLFPAFYAADSWHTAQRLTLTYGVRYEPYFPWNEIQGRVEQFSVAKYQAGIKSQVFPNARRTELPRRSWNAFSGHDRHAD